MEFLYRLQLVERLHNEAGWAEIDEEIIERHFEYLKGLTEKGTVVLAGRTLNEDSRTFGIVVFEAGSEDEAYGIMNSDPALVEGIMKCELFPFYVSLSRGKKC
jgi:uncharacterized protein YciI